MMEVKKLRVGIMQPYFFPYIGHFQLISHVDKWIVFDDVQYIRHGWINRNRILHPTNGWQYITVPLLKQGHKELIKNTKINNNIDWKVKIINQLAHYKNIAPYYDKTIKLIQEALNVETNHITILNVNILKVICSYLEIPFNYQISSDMNFDYSNVKESDDWALEISMQLGADEYVNPIGGKELFDQEKYDSQGIKLSFLSSNSDELKYKQGKKPFEPALSIIDVFMFCSQNEIKKMLNSYEVLEHEEFRNRRLFRIGIS